MANALESLLDAAGVTPILADVGCSGTRHRVWDPIASRSILLAFDPDGREVPCDLNGIYRKVIMVPQAVTDSDESNRVEFVLTKFPYCSSTLEPDLFALSAYAFRNYFEPVSRVSVSATSLNRVLDEFKLEGIDWLKIDSQGTDLRILKKFREDMFQRLSCIDTEPGLIDAYQGEDLYHAVDAFLRGKGFWLSDLRVQEYARVTPESLEEIEDLAKRLKLGAVGERIKRSPTAAEARYLRDPAACADRRVLVVLFVFALLDQQFGFAWDLRKRFAGMHADSKVVAAMEAALRNELFSVMPKPTPAHPSSSRRLIFSLDSSSLLLRLGRWFLPGSVRRWISRSLQGE